MMHVYVCSANEEKEISMDLAQSDTPVQDDARQMLIDNPDLPIYAWVDWQVVQEGRGKWFGIVSEIIKGKLYRGPCHLGPIEYGREPKWFGLDAEASYAEHERTAQGIEQMVEGILDYSPNPLLEELGIEPLPKTAHLGSHEEHLWNVAGEKVEEWIRGQYWEDCFFLHIER